MELLHKGIPDTSWIAGSGQARQFLGHVVAYPDTCRIIWRIAYKPAILIISGRPCLASAWHAAQGQAASRPFLDGGHQHICHHPRGIRLVYFLFFLLRLKQDFPFGICNFYDTGWLTELAVIFQRRIAGGHLHGRGAVSKASQGARWAVILLVQPGEIHGLQVGKTHFWRYLLQQIPSYGIFGSLHGAAEGNAALVRAAGIGGSLFFLHILYHGVWRILPLQDRGIDNERLDGAAWLAEALICTV